MTKAQRKEKYTRKYVFNTEECSKEGKEGQRSLGSHRKQVAK
jgi:hypothetical protein